MNARRFLTLAFLLATVTGVFAQGYQIPWYSVNSGGGPGANASCRANGSTAQAIQEGGVGGGQLGYWGLLGAGRAL